MVCPPPDGPSSLSFARIVVFLAWRPINLTRLSVSAELATAEGQTQTVLYLAQLAKQHGVVLDGKVSSTVALNYARSGNRAAFKDWLANFVPSEGETGTPPYLVKLLQFLRGEKLLEYASALESHQSMGLRRLEAYDSLSFADAMQPPQNDDLQQFESTGGATKSLPVWIRHFVAIRDWDCAL